METRNGILLVQDIYGGLVENARKFRESAPNQILIFGKPPPRVGVSENALRGQRVVA